jgi:hypothetical protein
MTTQGIRQLLISPDCSRDDWLRVGENEVYLAKQTDPAGTRAVLQLTVVRRRAATHGCT